jgi:hypothetical protein
MGGKSACLTVGVPWWVQQSVGERQIVDVAWRGEAKVLEVAVGLYYWRDDIKYTPAVSVPSLVDVPSTLVRLSAMTLTKDSTVK